MMAFLPAALRCRLRFGDLVVAGPDGAVSPLTAAHRRCWASLMRRRAAALNFLRLRVRTCGVAADSAPVTVLQLAKLSNLSVDLLLLRFEAFDGGKDYFVR